MWEKGWRRENKRQNDISVRKRCVKLSARKRRSENKGEDEKETGRGGICRGVGEWVVGP